MSCSSSWLQIRPGRFHQPQNSPKTPQIPHPRVGPQRGTPPHPQAGPPASDLPKNPLFHPILGSFCGSFQRRVWVRVTHRGAKLGVRDHRDAAIWGELGKIWAWSCRFNELCSFCGLITVGNEAGGAGLEPRVPPHPKSLMCTKKGIWGVQSEPPAAPRVVCLLRFVNG